jgi:hypothetical protein
MPSSAPYFSLQGTFFATAPFGLSSLFRGIEHGPSKMPEWALFEVLGHNIVPMKSGHFAGFSKNPRIGKPGILWGFRG